MWLKETHRVHHFFGLKSEKNILPTLPGLQGRSQKKNKGVSKSHDHGHMVYKNSGIMDTLYYNSLYLL